MGKKSNKKKNIKKVSELLGMNVAKVTKIAKRSNRLTPCAVKSEKWGISETCYNPFKKSTKMDGGYKDEYGKEVAEAIAKSYLSKVEKAVKPEEIKEGENNER